MLNVSNCFILHSIVQQFHKRTSRIGKTSRILFLTLFISLWWQLAFTLGNYKEGNTNTQQ